jgi:hypothetical protein
MYLELTGKPRKLKKSIVVKAIEYAQDYLNLPYDIDVEIIFEDLKGDAIGWAMDIDSENFEITIEKKLSTRDAIHTLLHELVHINQYATGKLVSAEGKRPNRWLGKPCYEKNYSKQPWEVEAYDLDKKMMRNFLRKCKKEGVEL